jgi:hypothetical protein
MRLLTLSGAVAAAMLLLGTPAKAVDFSFTGTFTQDDDVQLFNFTVGATSTVTLRSWSYAGGTNAAGTVIARGGFDPILALFDSAGNFIGDNDDGSSVPTDLLSNTAFDVLLTLDLAPGNYTVAISQFNNRAGAHLSDAFSRQGQGNFTGAPDFTIIDPECDTSQGKFLDVSGSPACNRDGHWAFDILNVAAADVVDPPPTSVPEPSAMALIGAALAALGFARRRA